MKFSAAEKVEYQKLESAAKHYYVNLRRKEEGQINRHYLKLIQKLMPQRVACAGGKYPLPESLPEHSGKRGDGVKKQIQYSQFAFTSKLNTLVAELKKIRDSDPASKCLIFSQFTPTLEWLQAELPRHGFQFRTLKGDMTMKQRAKALHDFQSDPPTTVFLLSMR